ncbi:hypothetical protein [Nostoc piscinale]|nr:hypothetical protein [Nostoc piscinale]
MLLCEKPRKARLQVGKAAQRTGFSVSLLYPAGSSLRVYDFL